MGSCKMWHISLMSILATACERVQQGVFGKMEPPQQESLGIVNRYPSAIMNYIFPLRHRKASDVLAANDSVVPTFEVQRKQILKGLFSLICTAAFLSVVVMVSLPIRSVYTISIPFIRNEDNDPLVAHLLLHY